VRTEIDQITGTEIRCDLVVPVFNGLTYVRECLESIFQYTKTVTYRLIIVDDCSDSFTRQYLETVASGRPNVVLTRNDTNLGFVKSSNLGIARGSAPFVVLVNSDVVVTPNWLDRLLDCAESDSRIGSVNPLTNHASQINVSVAPGGNFFGMDWVLRHREEQLFPDVVTGVGFCLLLRRAALQDVGVFDEVYGRGYCEESDLCMRMTTSGWRTVVADHVYVYHKGSATFKDRNERYLANRRTFDARWKEEYERQFKEFKERDPLEKTRAIFATPRRWDPMPMVWQTARGMSKEWNDRNWAGMIREGLRGAVRTVRNYRPVGTPESVATVTRPGRLRVTYVLRDIVVAGGVLSVIQLVNELILLGVEARIVATFEDPVIYQWTRLYTKPIIYRSPRELIDRFPESDIVVATLWATAPWVAEIYRRGRAKQTAYFVQDYEPWFFAEKERKKRDLVRQTYGMIANRIVKSDWLREMLRQDGFDATKISLGMDLARFYPRDVANTGPTVIAMARPGTPRRGFKSTIEALALVKEAMPSIYIILFGARDLDDAAIPFDFRNEGVVSDHDHLACLYSEADVFLDGSDFQGFGRCGLEAMACGTACVLTGVGGVGEYARDGENALVVPPQSPEIFAEAILRVLKDASLRNRLIDGGRATVEAYSQKKEARRTLEYFQTICPPAASLVTGATDLPSDRRV